MADGAGYEGVPALVPGKWPRDLETELFNAMCTHKPAGVSRHFEMVGIFQYMQPLYPSITVGDIWAHLRKLYNIDLLEERNEQDEEYSTPLVKGLTLPKGKDYVEFELPTEDKFIGGEMDKRTDKHPAAAEESDDDAGAADDDDSEDGEEETEKAGKKAKPARGGRASRSKNAATSSEPVSKKSKRGASSQKTSKTPKKRR